MKTLITIAVLLSMPSAFCEDNYGIQRPGNHTEAGIRRPVAPKQVNVGLNGKLVWVKDWLYLETPSGKKIKLDSKDNEITKALLEAVKQKNARIEIFGVLEENMLSVTKIESSGNDFSGYIVDAKPHRQQEVIKWANNADGILIQRVSTDSDALAIGTDFSEAEVKKMLEDAGLSSSVRDVRKNELSSASSSG